MITTNALIIPSAKKINNGITQFGEIPGIIYPINGRVVFDYLKEQYASYCSSLDIVCYENQTLVQQRLEDYSDDKIKIHCLKELRDLGYSVYFAIKDIDYPIIINFADTIVFDNVLDYLDDVFFYQEDYMSNVWTFYDQEDGVLKNIYDKKIPDDKIQKSFFVGVFRIVHTKYFKKCLKEFLSNPVEGISTFYSALMKYSEKHPFKSILTNNWCDVGHSNKYHSSQLGVKERVFNYIKIDKNRGILKKTSDAKEKFIGEINWYLKLPSDIEYVRPRIFGYSTEYSSPFLNMEYYAYTTVHELYLYGDLEYSAWNDIFKRILFVLNDFKRYTVIGNHIVESLKDIYLNKTLDRLSLLGKNDRFKVFFENPITVNGNKYKALYEISELLKKYIPLYLYNCQEFNIIHGDLCFANILIDDKLSFIKVIDPRGKFGYFDIYGDRRYELAKLFHSVDGKYDYIIKDMYTLRYDASSSNIAFKIKCSKSNEDIYNSFYSVFAEEIDGKLKEIELIEALLFLSMIPLHSESFEHQLVMLGTGLDILDRVVDIKI